MKKYFKTLLMAAMGLFAFTACEDVPEPYPVPGSGNGGDAVVTEPAGSGTLEDPYNVTAVIEYINTLGADVQSDKAVYVKGIVKNISTTESTIIQYGNHTFTMVDEGGNETFTAFQVYAPGNKKFTSLDQIKVGDEVVVYGKVVNYKGNTPETVGQGRSYVYSINGASEGGDQPGEGVEPEGSGTLENPYNVAAAIKYTNTLGADVPSDEAVYVKGIVKTISTTESAIAQFGNHTFTMVDEGGNESFTAFQVYAPGNKKFTSLDQIKVGDKVIVYGKVVNYMGNTPETVGKGQSYVYSINGVGEGGSEGGDEPGAATEVTCAEAAALTMAMEDGATSEEEYTVTGYITETNGTVSRNQQVFWMADTKDGGKVFQAYWANLPEPYEALPVGTKLKMTGKLLRYGSTAEMKNGNVVVLEKGEGGNEGGGNESGDATEYSIDLPYTMGTNCYDDGVATINGVAGCKVLKIGTSKNPGSFDMEVPAGKHSFYAVTWNNLSTAEVTFTIDGAPLKTVAVKGNAGAVGNSPYTITVTGSDKYEFELESAATVTVTSTSRIIFFGIK